MRVVKLALISVLALFLVLLAISLLLPSHVRISRATDVHASRQKILPLLTDLRKWDQWNLLIRNYHHRAAEQTMLKADEIQIFITAQKDSLVTADWQLPTGSKSVSGYAVISNGPGQSFVTVQWYFDFYLKWYPWEKFQSIVFDQQLGPDMEQSLDNLKKIAENSN